MSPALYADEEGRATMTRDVVVDHEPVRLETERNSSARKGVSQGPAGGRLPALARAWHSACPPPAPPSRHAYVLRIHTLTCHHRVKTELIEVNLSRFPFPSPFRPSYSFKARKSMPSSSETRGDVTPPCEDFASRKSPLVADSAGLLFLVGVSFARAEYRGRFVTEIRAGPFYRRNNYFEAQPARVGDCRPFSCGARSICLRRAHPKSSQMRSYD